MAERFRRHLSYANVMATVAVFLVLGGSAYAAATLPKNSVGSKQLRKSAVTSSKIRANAVTSSKVADGSLLKSDFAAGQLPAGPTGATGPTGPAGPTGATGPAGLTSLSRVDGPASPQGPFGSGTEVNSSTATCPSGRFVTGGGFDSSNIDNLIEYAKSSPTQYSVIAVNESSTAVTITAQAICAAGNGVSAASVRSKRAPAAVVSLAEKMQKQVDAKGGARR